LYGIVYVTAIDLQKSSANAGLHDFLFVSELMHVAFVPLSLPFSDLMQLVRRQENK